MSTETKENIFMITAGFLLTIITIALLYAVIYAALNPPHACVSHNGEWVKSVISYEKETSYNAATKTTISHKTGRIIYQFNGVKIVSNYVLCSTAEHLDDEIIDIVDAHLKELGHEPHHLMFSGVANKVQHAPGAYDEDENPLVIDSFYFHTYGFGEDK